jgi:hypothetical protein
MKLPATQKLVTDQDGRQRIVTREDPRLSASAKMARRKSNKQRPVKRSI